MQRLKRHVLVKTRSMVFAVVADEVRVLTTQHTHSSTDEIREMIELCRKTVLVPLNQCSVAKTWLNLVLMMRTMPPQRLKRSQHRSADL
ncbi:hypothetical protein OH492_28155 [Vibrio chagasii]|nr:hypothetical protein [Vibrio chagasii]